MEVDDQIKAPDAGPTGKDPCNHCRLRGPQKQDRRFGEIKKNALPQQEFERRIPRAFSSNYTDWANEASKNTFSVQIVTCFLFRFLIESMVHFYYTVKSWYMLSRIP